MEKDAKLRKISPSKFTLSLAKINKKWTSKDIRHFFESSLNQKISMRPETLKTQEGMDEPKM
jgi:hypothetical protein